MPLQDKWRFCYKCTGMFYDGYSNSVCPAGGTHNAYGYMYTLPYDEPETPTNQKKWRFCPKCCGMFFCPSGALGKWCPAGGLHGAQGYEFTLPHDVAPTEGAQDGWRYCHKCDGIFYELAGGGRCPAGNAHNNEGGAIYVLPHIPATAAINVKYFDANSITTSMALGGNAHLTVNRNGQWTFSWHVHDSGATDIRYTVVGMIMTAQGLALAVPPQHGRVEGTEEVFNIKRNHNGVVGGTDPTLAQSFDEICATGRFDARLSGVDLLGEAAKSFVGDFANNFAHQMGAAGVAALVVLILA